MILEWILIAFVGIIKALFGLLPNMPMLPEFIGSSITALFDLVFDNVQLLGFFISISMIKVLVPCLILVENFDHIYHFVVWILKKIPISIE